MTQTTTLARIGATLARVVGMLFALLGAWVLIGNMIDVRYSGWVLAWVLASGALGGAGGTIYLLSFDGPPRLRTPRVRLLGWLGMLALAVLPSSLILVLPLVLLALIPTLPERGEQPEPQSEA